MRPRFEPSGLPPAREATLKLGSPPPQLNFTSKGQFRQIVRLDLGGQATNATATIVASLGGYKQNLPPTALDASTGRLTTMMLPQAGFAANLVTVDLKSGAVLSDPQLCKQYTDCPWALAWAAGPKTA